MHVLTTALPVPTRELVEPSKHACAHHGALASSPQVEPSRVTYDILLRAAWAMSATSRFLELKELIAQVRAADEP